MPSIVSDHFDDVAPHVTHGGTCSEKQYLRHINRALRLLWNRGDWEGTIVRCVIGATANQFTLPWELETIRHAWLGCKPIPVRNKWFEVMPFAGIQNCKGRCVTDQVVKIEDVIVTPMPWKEGHICVYKTKQEDKDKEIVFNYKDEYGVQKNVALTEGCSSCFAAEINGVSMEAHAGPVRLFSRDPALKKETYNGFYHPLQTNPSFSQYKICECGCCEQLLVRAKRRFVPVRTMDDLTYIDNTIALAFASEAINHLGKDNEMYAENLNLAEENLNEDIENTTEEPFLPIATELHDNPLNLRSTYAGRR